MHASRVSTNDRNSRPALAGADKEKNWLINKHGEKYQTFEQFTSTISHSLSPIKNNNLSQTLNFLNNTYLNMTSCLKEKSQTDWTSTVQKFNCDNVDIRSYTKSQCV